MQPRHHGQERAAGSDRHGFESRCGRMGVPQKAATALDRYGHVEEVAALVAFVAGLESSYVTGANLTVDDGMNA
jgi:NAD(P)-dependent dehydrogenase (short-subunit alcohol dehydrogenase family)